VLSSIRFIGWPKNGARRDARAGRQAPGPNRSVVKGNMFSIAASGIQGKPYRVQKKSRRNADVGRSVHGAALVN